jgi:hypothetical protein
MYKSQIIVTILDFFYQKNKNIEENYNKLNIRRLTILIHFHYYIYKVCSFICEANKKKFQLNIYTDVSFNFFYTYLYLSSGVVSRRKKMITCTAQYILIKISVNYLYSNANWYDHRKI